MRKLTLDLDALTVESFDAQGDGAARRGTVRGNDRWEEPIDYKETQQPTCVTCVNCGPGGTAVSCGATCGASCGATCGDATCGLTFCVDTCDYCMSRVTDYPAIC